MNFNRFDVIHRNPMDTTMPLFHNNLHHMDDTILIEMNPSIQSDCCNSIAKSGAEERTVSFDDSATAMGIGKVDSRLDLLMVNREKRELRSSTHLGQYQSTSCAFFSSGDVSRQPVKPVVSPTNSTTRETSTLEGATNKQSRGLQRSNFSSPRRSPRSRPVIRKAAPDFPPQQFQRKHLVAMGRRSRWDALDTGTSRPSAPLIMPQRKQETQPSHGDQPPSHSLASDSVNCNHCKPDKQI
ncbi:hypothetical protein IV203_020573 [Nitzschia inconspicua]|uniref:Uncharacterized protein n=1 Tax=Nitzschia inconspicua TaxID=303405 RepID=A0A9K3PF63_9STRA|nr:hypothetical protein IV203_020573 [Nitzschia inconspicua]